MVDITTLVQIKCLTSTMNELTTTDDCCRFCNIDFCLLGTGLVPPGAAEAATEGPLLAFAFIRDLPGMGPLCFGLVFV